MNRRGTPTFAHPKPARGVRTCLLGAFLALSVSTVADASPALDGTRNLSMGGATRGSSAGTNGALINPAGISYVQQFSIDPVYQIAVGDRTHGIGILITDSLNNRRFALSLGYTFMRGAPRLGYVNPDGNNDQLDLSHFGHEVAGVISVAAVMNWLYIAVKPKYQYTSLRYLDDDGAAVDARDKLNAFGLDAAVALNFADWVRIGVVGYNLVGADDPNWTEDEPIEFENVAIEDGSEDQIDYNNLRRVSDYPLSVGHGVAVFPLKTPDFSLNVDAVYDFTSFKNQDAMRTTIHGGGEFVLRGVPIRLGGFWDSRGNGEADDRGYVNFGSGYIRNAPVGGVGVDFGVGVQQQVTGPGPFDTVVGVNLGIRIHPDL